MMLHADRDKVEKPEPGGREEIPRCPGPHARIARRYAAVAARDPETQDFARRFFLTMALLRQHKACFEDALVEARAGLELFPRDGLLLLTAGCVLEERAILTTASGKDDGPGDMAKEWLKDAQRDFTDAVANDPDLILARVRLGRVLWRLGQAGRGATEPWRRLCHARASPIIATWPTSSWDAFTRTRGGWTRPSQRTGKRSGLSASAIRRRRLGACAAARGGGGRGATGARPGSG